MEYIKFNIDEMYQEIVFCEYREIKDGVKGPYIQRAFPFEKIGDVEPKIMKMVEGEIIGIFYEEKGNSSVSGQVFRPLEPMSEEDIIWAKEFVIRACVEEEWDELLKPPTVDQQVEDFIKEFFEDDEEESLEQKDFLGRVFC